MTVNVNPTNRRPTMKVKISRHAIRDGEPRDHRRCALALAMSRQTRRECEVFGNVAIVHRLDYQERYPIRVGSEVHRFLEDFDYRKPVQPCMLDLGEGAIRER